MIPPYPTAVGVTLPPGHLCICTVLGWVSLHWGRGQWVCTPLPLTGLIHTHMQIAADPGQVFI